MVEKKAQFTEKTIMSSDGQPLTLKVYKNPKEDPKIKEALARAKNNADRRMMVEGSPQVDVRPKIDAEEEAWAFREYSQENPDFAEAYRDQIPAINRALIILEAEQEGAEPMTRPGLDAAAEVGGIVSSINRTIMNSKIGKKAQALFERAVAMGADAAGKAVDVAVSGFLSELGPIGKAIGWVAGKLTKYTIILTAKLAKQFKDLGIALSFYGGIAVSAVAAAVVFLASAVLAALVTPLFIIFIGVPIFTMFTIFIINQSGWVVPPWYGDGVSFTTPVGGAILDSAFIDVTKEPSPGSASSAPATITYTITIVAEKSTLTDVTYNYECEAFRKSGTLSCPPSPDVVQIAQETCGDTISPLEPCTFSYTVEYNSSFQDSVVTDTILVTATAEGLAGEKSNASANVIIGDPPTGCLVPFGSWPANQLAMFTQASVALQTRYPSYMAKVCSGPTIPVCYKNTDNYWGYHHYEHDTGKCDIALHKNAFGSITDTTYLLAHETGHHLDSINGTYMRQYLDSGAFGEAPMCTYPATRVDSEAFAEAIGLNTGLPSLWAKCGGGTYSSKYPKNYEFVNRVLF